MTGDEREGDGEGEQETLDVSFLARIRVTKAHVRALRAADVRPGAPSERAGIEKDPPEPPAAAGRLDRGRASHAVRAASHPFRLVDLRTQVSGREGRFWEER